MLTPKTKSSDIYINTIRKRLPNYRQKELLDKTDSIRKMVKFFVVLTVIGMVCGFILALVAMSKGSSYSYY